MPRTDKLNPGQLLTGLRSREAQEFLDSRENTVAGGTAWERIAKLVDMSDKAVRSGKSDKTQFRAMLMSLRKDEKVHCCPSLFQFLFTDTIYS
jgi:hypothetical protein